MEANRGIGQSGGKDWIFLSDAHFTGENPDNQERLVRFLGVERENLDTLVLLGDLFEFWFGFEGHIYEEYLPIVEELKSLSHRGVRIKYVEGNHDFCLGPFFEEDLGAEVFADEMEETLSGKRIYIAHGDRVDHRDYGYRFFRRALKNRFSYALMRWAGPALSMKVAKRLSARSRRKNHYQLPGNIPIFRTFAMKKFREGIDVVILGHSHYPEEILERIDGREKAYFNVGDWITYFSYLRYRPKSGFELCYHDDRP
ncbi:MAG: UDP-2,3-diacylglucosamine diphosphatase [Syntrophobacterales bacterium]|nr:MAG: UDP-2,3-diacylglucosamine diphosphatase [Syntrophobacterales bacterium]